MCDPDDIIVGVVSTLTSRNTVPRDVHERSCRTRSDPSTRRYGRNSSSLTCVDYGVGAESVVSSSLSAAFTEDVHNELVVPRAVNDSLNTAMNTHTTSFDCNVSYVADTKRNRLAYKEDRTNRIKCSVSDSRKTKKKKMKTTTKKSTKDSNEKRDSEDRRETAAAATAVPESQLVDQSLWEIDGDKLWRFCAQILGCSDNLHGTDGVEARLAELREPGRPIAMLFIYLFIQFINPHQQQEHKNI